MSGRTSPAAAARRGCPRYPKTDGDNIKALYLLSTVAPLAVCGGWALAQVRRAGTLAFAGVLLLLAAFLYSDLTFLVLPA